MDETYFPQDLTFCLDPICPEDLFAGAPWRQTWHGAFLEKDGRCRCPSRRDTGTGVGRVGEWRGGVALEGHSLT